MKSKFHIFLLCLFPFAMASAQEEVAPVTPPADDMVVAERGGAVLTVGEMRAKVRSSLSPKKRRGYFSDGTKVGVLVDNLLSTRQLANIAKSKGLDQDPEFLAEVEEHVQDLLARRQLALHMDNLDEPDFEALARERYQVNKQGFFVPATRDVRHILILLDEREMEEAKAIAEKVQALLLEGTDFDEVMKEYSEDPAFRHKGWVKGVGSEQYDAAFTAAVAGLEEVGDVSEPVLTPFGYHVIRLEKDNAERIRPFDEVKSELMEKAKNEFRAAARSAYLDTFTAEPLELNEEAMKVLPFAEP